MSLFWIVVGIVILAVFGGAGWLSGEFKRVLDDPEVKAQIEAAKKERERKAAWEAKKK